MAEISKHNCSVVDTVLSGDVCVDATEEECRNEMIDVTRIGSETVCYDETRTVCTVTTEAVKTNKCQYHYQYR